MTHPRLTTIAAAIVLLLVALTGCSDDEPGRSPDLDPSTGEASRATTSAAPSESDLASQAATDLVHTYYRLRDELRQEPKTSLRRLESVATSTELEAQRTLFQSERDEKVRQTGSTEITVLKVQSINLDNSDPAGGAVPTVEVDVCWDVSDVDILNSAGKSIVSPDRPDTGWIRYTVANYEWDADPAGGWRVATSQDLQRAPCAVS